MLLCLTPNPAIDRVLVVPGFRNAEVCRVTERRDLAGGKGLNVARAARTLGFPARACGPLAGDTGRTIAALAAAEGLDATWAWLPAGESRICVLVTDPQAHDTLTINEPGPHLSPEAWELVAAHIRGAASDATALASSGSLPPGVAPAAFLDLLSEIGAARPVYLDTSGATLAAALDRALAMLKVNAHELGEALGRSIETPQEAAEAARAVHKRGPRTVVVTLGRHGAVAVAGEEAWWALPPAIAPVSPVGSGDTLLAGVAAATLRGASLPDALRLGVACGAANALVLGAGVMHSEDVERLHAATQLTRL
ncbi:MAG: hexose kinase [Chloroflexota bacterium]